MSRKQMQSYVYRYQKVRLTRQSAAAICWCSRQATDKLAKVNRERISLFERAYRAAQLFASSLFADRIEKTRLPFSSAPELRVQRSNTGAYLLAYASEALIGPINH